MGGVEELVRLPQALRGAGNVRLAGEGTVFPLSRRKEGAGLGITKAYHKYGLARRTSRRSPGWSDSQKKPTTPKPPKPDEPPPPKEDQKTLTMFLAKVLQRLEFYRDEAAFLDQDKKESPEHLRNLIKETVALLLKRRRCCPSRTKEMERRVASRIEKERAQCMPEGLVNQLDPSSSTVLTDCVQGMQQLPDCCIPLTVTSPPYDDFREYGGHTLRLRGGRPGTLPGDRHRRRCRVGSPGPGRKRLVHRHQAPAGGLLPGTRVRHPQRVDPGGAQQPDSPKGEVHAHVAHGVRLRQRTSPVCEPAA